MSRQVRDRSSMVENLEHTETMWLKCVIRTPSWTMGMQKLVLKYVLAENWEEKVVMLDMELACCSISSSILLKADLREGFLATTFSELKLTAPDSKAPLGLTFLSSNFS